VRARDGVLRQGSRESGQRKRAWGTASRARLLWHVTANEASAAASPRDWRRLDTRQDTPPGAFRV